MLDNSLNDERLGSKSRVERDLGDNDDILSLQPGQAESREMDLDSQSKFSEPRNAEDDTSDRFLKYKSSDNVSEEHVKFCWTCSEMMLVLRNRGLVQECFWTSHN